MPATFSQGKELLVPVKLEDGWAIEPVGIWWQWEKIPSLPC